MKLIYLVSKYTLCLILLGTTLLSCKKSDNATEKGKVNISPTFGKIGYFATASTSVPKAPASIKSNVKIMSDTAVNTVAVDWLSASIWVEKINFAGKNGRLLDTTIMVAKNINIFNAEALVGIIKLPTGAYKDINVKLYCRKSPKSEFAFDFRGTFANVSGGKDSIRVGSSYPFEADLKVNDIVINPSDNYKATFHFDLSKVLTGISNSAIQNTLKKNSLNQYIIWKGGSQDEPFYDQVIQNWQNVASIVIIKDGANAVWK